MTIESFMLPSLYGDVVMIVPLARTKPLTQRQLEFLLKGMEVLKAFFNADGSPAGVPMPTLESNRYREICSVAGIYWSDYRDLTANYDQMSASSTDGK